MDELMENGWCVIPQFIDHNLIERMIDDLESAYQFCRKIQIRNEVSKSEGTCHHLIGLGASFLDCLSRYEEINDKIESYFGGKYILNSFGGNILSKGMSYANNIHRDIRSFSGEIPLMMNTLIMLDDFTESNGATWLMNGGHTLKEKPTEEEFMKSAFQITGNAGDLVMFNSNLWHRAGENRTAYPRRSVTPLFSRPFYKQGYDYYRALPNIETESDYLKQVLGYYSRVPVTLSDWYSPPHLRMYRDGQG